MRVITVPLTMLYFFFVCVPVAGILVVGMEGYFFDKTNSMKILIGMFLTLFAQQIIVITAIAIEAWKKERMMRKALLNN